MDRFMVLITLSLLLLSGCPQSPTEDPTGANGSSAPPAVKAKIKARDLPGGEASGPPPSTSPGPPPDNISFEVEGEGIALRGALVYSGDQEGALRLDMLVLEENRPPQLAHTQTVGEDGAFDITAPPDFGPVYVVGFIDVAGDGPSPTDPAGMLEILIGDTDIEGITLTLSDDPDLGPLTPGGGDDGAPDGPPKAPDTVEPPPDEAPPVPLEEIEDAPVPAEEGAEAPTDGDTPPPE